MMQSKPVIIVAAIVAGIIGLWVGVNVFTSGLAQILAIVIVALIGYLIYNGVSRNRSVAVLDDAERRRALADAPASGARLIVYREGFVAKLSGIDIAVDGTRRAQLKSPQSVALDIAPGDHALVLTVAGKAQPPFAFSAGAGETVVLRVTMSMSGPAITREPEGPAVRGKLGDIPMVLPDDAAAGAAVRP